MSSVVGRDSGATCPHVQTQLLIWSIFQIIMQRILSFPKGPYIFSATFTHAGTNNIIYNTDNNTNNTNILWHQHMTCDSVEETSPIFRVLMRSLPCCVYPSPRSSLFSNCAEIYRHPFCFPSDPFTRCDVAFQLARSSSAARAFPTEHSRRPTFPVYIRTTRNAIICSGEWITRESISPFHISDVEGLQPGLVAKRFHGVINLELTTGRTNTQVR